MEIELCRVRHEDSDIFERLFQFFAYDFSELNGMDIGNDGKYHGLNDIPDYFAKSDYCSYFIKVDNKYAGLAVIKFNESEGTNYLRHFFILRKYRKHKVGQIAVHRIFDNFTGKWIVSQFDFNIPAITFWRKVIDRYTNGDYIEKRRDDNKGPQQEFLKKKE